ncbi:28S ribosomal protein S5 mitochondrial [Biomphalaria pfeifferi]|uniref:Small ribosomal subunit protein uS5m n=1 Tax=Biomphalaria pfeifferi TaxID=112525 RepID=A0AAD8BSL0_BIOPF|nr:28S ribosomal protein S5 mitochondrial [Biomphalaria pfeifferi]
MATSYLIRTVTQSCKLGLRFNPTVNSNAYIFHPSTSIVQISFSRTYVSFVNKVTADQLWSGVTSVSNAGKKRGRGRSVKKRLDLNKGQRLGVGKSEMVFPGLTGPAMTGKKILEVYQPKKDESAEAASAQKKVPERKRRFPKIPSLLRGYSGRKFAGTSIGPPDPINDYVFNGFDSKVLEYKIVNHMTGNLGRKARISALVVTGNGNGLAGFAVAKAATGKAALRKAKNMAAQRLQYFERYQNHTVFHNFAVTESKTTIFVQKKPAGHGVVAHRVIKTMCELIGIKDLYAKTEGQTGIIQNVTKAFFKGLMEQETHQQLADRMQLNVVEYRPEMENVPIPVAKPSQGFSRPDPIKEEAFDFNNMYYKDGRIPLKKYVDPDLQFKLPSTLRYFLNQHKHRNQKHARYLRHVHGLEPSPEEVKFRQKPLK